MKRKENPYGKYLLMIGVSMIAMYLLMYLNTFEVSHIRWSETRFYMTLIMGASMATIMLLLMWGMYESRIANLTVLAVSGLVFLIALYLVRSQDFVQDRSWMKAMIPHHSIAILTSGRAELRDLRVQELAKNIVEAQEREIKEMNWLLSDIKENGIAESVEQRDARKVPVFNE